MKPDLLAVFDLSAEEREIIGRTYTVHLGVTPRARREQINRLGPTIRAVLTSGRSGLTGEEIEAMPRLGIICCLGAGYEGVDVEAASRRGILVTHSPGANSSSVADHAMALLLAVVRNIRETDQRVRDGGWWRSGDLPSQLTGKRIGILGLGRIGLRIAQRAAGFEMEIAYHSRHRRPEVPYAWMETPLALAQHSDFLMVATPGGPATYHMIDRKILDAIGPSGYLVNIGRGSLVDTKELIAALREKRIAGAGLDVLEEEPMIPMALRELPNVVITPHIGGRSPESMQALMKMVLSNLDAYFSGRPVLTPVSDS